VARVALDNGRMSSLPKPPPDTLTPEARLQEGGLHDVLGYQLAQASLLTDQRFVSAVGKPTGLGQVEFTLLHLIKQNAKVTPSRLARALAVSMPAITVWMGKLEQRGLITRRRSATDRRSAHVEVTAEGQALVTQAMAAVLAEEAQLLAQLSAAERAMLLELLRKVARQRKT
jgi:DNA-binding MarR family transcriptional regulator